MFLAILSVGNGLDFSLSNLAAKLLLQHLPLTANVSQATIDLSATDFTIAAEVLRRQPTDKAVEGGEQSVFFCKGHVADAGDFFINVKAFGVLS